MTNDEIDKMEAGSDTDKLIASEIFQLQPVNWNGITAADLGLYEPGYFYMPGGGIAKVDNYSTNMSAAWEVVEKIKEARAYIGENFTVTYNYYTESWLAGYEAYGTLWTYAAAQTAALAICKLALKLKYEATNKTA